MGKPITQPSKGCRDFLPPEVKKREYVIGVIREIFEAHGFEPLQTPALERLDTLLGKYGEEGDQLIFKVLLRGQPLVEGIRAAAEHLQKPGALVSGRSGETAPGAETLLADMGLRYDQTAPLARVYAGYAGKLPQIFKCYQIQPVWRADTPGKGRFREFYQCDVDVMGSSSKLTEAELTGAASECLLKLGFQDFAVRLNHRGLLRALMRSAAVSPAQENAAITAVDKLDKIGAEGVAAELAAHGIAAETSCALIASITQEMTLDRAESLVAQFEIGAGAISELRSVLQLAEATRAAGRIRFDPTLARGLDYYTGCIFEIVSPGIASSLGGGGRYDDLIGMFSHKSAPACGISLGLERILAVMEERGLFPASLGNLDAVLAFVDEADQRAALSLAGILRAEGFRVDLRPQPVSPGKLRKYADERRVSFAVWLESGALDCASIWRRDDGKTAAELNFEKVIEFMRDHAARK